MPAPIKPNFDFSPTFLFDAIILGAGPAGLSAALVLCRMNRPVLVFSNSQFRNERAHRAHTILGHDHTPPADIRKKAREQIEAYGTVYFVEQEVVAAKKTSSEDQSTLFEVTDSTGQIWQGKKLILAMGVRDILPTNIPGYEENWGHSIYQCLFCDGLERSDQPAGTLGFPNPTMLHVGMMVHMGCPKVTIFANGNLEPKDAETAHAINTAKVQETEVDERIISRLVKLEEEEGIEIRFEDGSNTRVGFLAHRPDLEVVGAGLMTNLGVEIFPDGAGGQMIRRNEPFGQTNVEGVLACGDVGIMMRQVTAAMFQGTSAGAGVHFLISQNAEEVEAETK